MYWKQQRYEKTKTSSLASTHKVELPDSGLLDNISMYFRHTNAATILNDAPGNIWHHLTKIEVIGDTDKKLFSMTGECAIAKAFRKIGRLPSMKQNEEPNKTQDLTIPIFFGRRPLDGRYLLNLSEWDKVVLEVTNDLTTTFVGSTGFSMETKLCTLEDSVERHPKFMKQWEYDASSPDSDADYVRPKLPTSGLLRSLMIQLDPTLTATTGQCAEDPAGDSYNWKLWFKDRALTIMDHRPRDIMRDEHNRLGMGVSNLKTRQHSTRFQDRHWAEVLSIVNMNTGSSGDTTVSAEEDSRDRFAKENFVGDAAFLQKLIQGVGLFHTFEIPFYVIQDEETHYLNIANYKPIEIEWYGHKEDNTHRMILEKPIGQGPAEFA